MVPSWIHFRCITRETPINTIFRTHYIPWSHSPKILIADVISISYLKLFMNILLPHLKTENNILQMTFCIKWLKRCKTFRTSTLHSKVLLFLPSTVLRVLHVLDHTSIYTLTHKNSTASITTPTVILIYTLFSYKYYLKIFFPLIALIQIHSIHFWKAMRYLIKWFYLVFFNQNCFFRFVFVFYYKNTEMNMLVP